jgi:hypothetical protein
VAEGGATAAAPWFEDTAGEAGLVFQHSTGASGEFLFPETLAGGIALIDFDGDGHLDVFLGQGGSLRGEEGPGVGRHRLFRNRGDGTFEDRTEGSGVDVPGYCMGVAVGDFDGDGREDLYITNNGPNVLLRNAGGGRFEDVTAAAGVAGSEWSTSATFVDHDLDGDLDLFVCNYIFWSLGGDKECYEASGRRTYCGPSSYNAPTPDTLFRNDGDGRFTDVSEQAGIRTRFGNGLGVVAGDYNGDGTPDLFVANDQTEDQLWINLGDGTFRDDGYRVGVAVGRDGSERAGMGVDAADVDADGDLDLIVVNLHGEFDGFYRNDGDSFVERTTEAGIGVETRKYTRFGVGFHDFDNDGDLDLYEACGRVTMVGSLHDEDDPFAEPNVLLELGEDGRWRTTGLAGGTRSPLVHTSRGAAFGDLDGDGGIDIVVANSQAAPYLLRNTVPDRGHWIRARVLGASGAAAIGAVVELDGSRLRRDVRPGYSFCSSSDPGVHFGLGERVEPVHLEVRWTDGSRERFGPFEVDRAVVLRPGEGEAR